MHILCPQNSTFMYLRHLNSHMSLPLVSVSWSLWFPVILRVFFSLLSLKDSEFVVSLLFSQLPLYLFPGILLCAFWSWWFTIRNILQSLHLMTKCSFTSIQNKALYRAVLALREDMASLKSSQEMESFSHDPGAHLHKESGTPPQWSDLNSCLYSLFLLPTCKLLSLFSELLQLLPSPVTF